MPPSEGVLVLGVCSGGADVEPPALPLDCEFVPPDPEEGVFGALDELPLAPEDPVLGLEVEEPELVDLQVLLLYVPEL
jgi:hypothetical protein